VCEMCWCEVHGHMLGPEAAYGIGSDDSNKVGASRLARPWQVSARQASGYDGVVL
jgi:hypothetical protein